MKIFIGIVVFIALLVVYLLLKQRSGTNNVRPDVRRKAIAQPSASFHAVSLKIASDACEAAKRMQGRRFLSSAAPRIPLRDCDVLECKCKFVHHKDRRSGDDRRDGYGQGFGNTTGQFETDKRGGRERRHEPPNDTFS